MSVISTSKTREKSDQRHWVHHFFTPIGSILYSSLGPASGRGQAIFMGKMMNRICTYIYIWVNYNISLTWIKAIWGWFLLLTMIPVRSQWGRYNLPRYIRMYIHIWKIPAENKDKCARTMLASDFPCQCGFSNQTKGFPNHFRDHHMKIPWSQIRVFIPHGFWGGASYEQGMGS